MKDEFRKVLEDVLRQPSLQVIHYQLPRLTALQLANILSWAYNGLYLHHLDTDAKRYEKK